MKKIFILFLCMLLLFPLVGCVREVQVGSEMVSAYGLMNQDEAVPGVKYEISVNNAVWTALSVETIVTPILYFMYYIWVPVEVEHGNQTN